MDMPEGFELVAILEREGSPRCLVSPVHASLHDLPPGAVVGTSSLRRQVQLQALRPDLCIEAPGGHLDTRLRKLDEGQYAAASCWPRPASRLGPGRTASAAPVLRNRCCGGRQGALA